MKKTISLILLLSCGTACFAQNTEKINVKERVAEYAYYDLKTDVSKLSDNDKKLLPIFVRISEIMDGLFWKQTYGDVADFKKIKDPVVRDYVQINYGPWDRLDDNHPFVEGYDAKPDACQYYPQDITREEYDTYADPNKSSLYTVLRRDANGKLTTVWYHDEYQKEIKEVCDLLDQAIAKDPSIENLYCIKGSVNEKLGRYDAAIENYREAQKLNAPEARGLACEGQLYYNLAAKTDSEASQLDYKEYKKYDELKAITNDYLKKAASAFEACYEKTADEGLKASVANCLKSVFFYLRNQSDEYMSKYEKYRKVVDGE